MRARSNCGENWVTNFFVKAEKSNVARELARSFLPRAPQRAQPIPVHHIRDIVVVKIARGERVRQTLYVRDGIQIIGRRFAPKSAVQIRADAAVQTIARDLAHVVNVFRDGGDGRLPIMALAKTSFGNQHPYIERGANHRVALNQRVNLFIA